MKKYLLTLAAGALSLAIITGCGAAEEEPVDEPLVRRSSCGRRSTIR